MPKSYLVFLQALSGAMMAATAGLAYGNGEPTVGVVLAAVAAFAFVLAAFATAARLIDEAGKQG